MNIIKATIKGQVLIPVKLRKKYGIKKGAKLAIYDRDGEIILHPLKENPIEYGLGLFKKGASAKKVLLKEREKDAKK